MKIKNIFPKWSNKKVKNGSYSIVITVIVIAIVIVINLVIGQLPGKYTKLDFSDNKLYTIGDKTEEIIKGLKSDVTLYLIAQKGQEDSTLKEVLDRYKDLSSHIKVEIKDPALYPNFASQYTDEKVSSNSIIVVGEKRNKVINYSDIYETSVDYSTYSSQVTGFDGEGQITSAISYVTSEELPVMYVLGGHDEASVSTTMKSAIEKENIEIKDLNLVSQESVPEDADCLFLFSPTKDISADEASKIINYLKAGGKAMIVSDYTGTEMPNFESVLKEYGVETMGGVVIEGDANHYASGNPLYLLPNIGSQEVVSSLSGRFVLMPVAQGIKTLDDKRDTVNVSSLLTTSDSAYIKKDAENMTSLSKEDGDESGAYDLGVAITETVDDKETKLVYLSSGNMLNEQIDSAVSGANTELLTNALSWMCDQEASVSIPSKSTQVSYLTITSAASAFLSSLAIVILPLICLLTGGVIWFRRRKR